MLFFGNKKTLIFTFFATLKVDNREDDDTFGHNVWWRVQDITPCHRHACHLPLGFSSSSSWYYRGTQPNFGFVFLCQYAKVNRAKQCSNVIIIFKKKLQRWKMQCQRYDCFLVQIIMITFGGSTRTVIEWGIQWKCLKKQTCAICLKIRMIGDIKWSPIQLVPHFSTIWTPFYIIITMYHTLLKFNNPATVGKSQVPKTVL